MKPSYVTIGDILEFGDPTGKFYMDPEIDKNDLEFLFDLEVSNNLARIVTIHQKGEEYELSAVEARPLRDNGDYTYWMDFRLVLVRDLPSELQPLAIKLLDKYKQGRIK